MAKLIPASRKTLQYFKLVIRKIKFKQHRLQALVITKFIKETKQKDLF